MPDQIYGRIELPTIPENVDAEMRQYLIELHDAIQNILTGHVSVNGDLHIDGFLYMQAQNRIKTYVP
jgi:hypothetical protein